MNEINSDEMKITMCYLLQWQPERKLTFVVIHQQREKNIVALIRKLIVMWRWTLTLAVKSQRMCTKFNCVVILEVKKHTLFSLSRSLCSLTILRCQNFKCLAFNFVMWFKFHFWLFVFEKEENTKWFKLDDGQQPSENR